MELRNVAPLIKVVPVELVFELGADACGNDVERQLLRNPLEVEVTITGGGCSKAPGAYDGARIVFRKNEST